MQFIGHLLQAGIFIGSGLGKINDPAATAGMIKSSPFPRFVDDLTGGAIKVDYNLFAQVLGGAFVLFGALLVLGLARRFAALALALLLIPITAFMHVNLKDPKSTSLDNMIHSMKNLSIIGGLLVVALAPKRRKVAAETLPARPASSSPPKPTLPVKKTK